MRNRRELKLVLLLVIVCSATLPMSARSARKVSLHDLDGKKTRVSDLSGNIVVLNFWATWCGPCRVEMPWLAQTFDRYRSRGLTILGVNMDDGDMPNVERFAREMGVTYPIARNNDAIVAAYGGVRFLPQSFLIGRRGVILQRIFGMPAATRDVETEIVRALSKR